MKLLLKLILRLKQKPIFWLVLFSVFSYHLWFSFNIFTNSDWWFNYSESIVEQIFPSLWQTRSATGDVESVLFRSPIDQTIGHLSNFFNINSHIIDRIIYFWPIIFLLPIASFFFIRKIVKNESAALVGAFVISFNTYFLTIDTAGHGLITVAFSFVITALYFFISAIEERKYYQWIVAALLFSLAGFMDFRVLYVTIFIILTIYIKEFNRCKNFLSENKAWFIFCLTILFLNIFWLLPILFLESGFGDGVLARPLFGDQFWSLSHAITLTHPFWTGSAPAWFSTQPIPFYFWLTPVLAILGLLVTRRDSYAVAFGFLALIGIFLSKQSDAPIVWFYSWAYENFPGFNAFREGSKFYILILTSYGVLIAFFVKWLAAKGVSPLIKYLPIGICILFGLNTIPMIDGSMQTMFVEKEINIDYLLLKDTLTQDNQYFRTYWTPISTKWTFGSNNHPKGSVVDLISNPLFASPDEKIENKIIDIFHQEYSNNIFDSMAIKYFGVPTSGFETYEDNFKDYGGKENSNISNEYINQLDTLPYLKRIDIGAKELVVYENEGYSPYIHPMTRLLEYDSFTNLGKKYVFSSSTLGLPFDFLVSEKAQKNFPTTQVTQPFEDITLSDLASNEITRHIKLANSSYNLYTNTSKQALSYKNESNVLQFKSTYTPSLTINSQVIDSDAKNTPLATLQLNPNNAYIALSGSRILHLEKTNNYQDIDSGSGKLYIYEVSGLNTLLDGSFENGLWQEKVGDCNNFDELPILGMARSTESSDGGYSLELSATRHTACTNTGIGALESGEEYLFSFDYQGDPAAEAGFYLSFDTSTTTVISEKQSITDGAWQHYEKIIRTPMSLANPRLHLYAYSTNEITNNLVRYDNIQIQKITSIASLDTHIPDTFVATPLPSTSNENTFIYFNSKTDFSNKVINGDLTSGLWANEVGDCHNYDEYSDIDMKLVTSSKDSGQALELEATRHNACTGPSPIPVVEGKTYLLTFEYQSDDTTDAGFNLGWNGTSTPDIHERIAVSNPSWQTFEKQITAPDGVSSASLLFYAYEKDGVTPIKVRYDNVSLIELPNIQNRYYLVSEPKTNFVEPKEITFDLVNPTKKLVHIKGATTPFYLAMSESFHSQWQAQFNNEKVNGFFDSWVPFVNPDRIPDEHHFELNGFLNGWYVDTAQYCTESNLCTQNPDGSYDMELVLEFFPQRWFYLGLLISGTTLVSILGYLSYDFIHRRRRKVSVVEISKQM